jgi:hypothetical protein
MRHPIVDQEDTVEREGVAHRYCTVGKPVEVLGDGAVRECSAVPSRTVARSASTVAVANSEGRGPRSRDDGSYQTVPPISASLKQRSMAAAEKS